MSVQRKGSGSEVERRWRQTGGRELPPAARRALEEAEARRALAQPERPRELNGRGGRDPARYGDWEVRGIATDF